MHGFEHRHTVQAALAWLDAQLRILETEMIPLAAAAGRVLAAPTVSDVDVPGFDRATMDGYAVRAQAIEGASSYSPITLRVVGNAMPAARPPRIRATKRMSTEPAVPAMIEAGIVIAMPRTTISLRP